MHSFVFGCGFCHFCSFWKIWVPPTCGIKHAVAQQFFLGDLWCVHVERWPWSGDGRHGCGALCKALEGADRAVRRQPGANNICSH